MAFDFNRSNTVAQMLILYHHATIGICKRLMPFFMIDKFSALVAGNAINSSIYSRYFAEFNIGRYTRTKRLAKFIPCLQYKVNSNTQWLNHFKSNHSNFMKSAVLAVIDSRIEAIFKIQKIRNFKRLLFFHPTFIVIFENSNADYLTNQLL